MATVTTKKRSKSNSKRASASSKSRPVHIPTDIPSSAEYVPKSVYDALQNDYLDLQNRYNEFELSFFEADRGHGISVNFLQNALAKKEAELSDIKTENAKLHVSVEDERQKMLQDIEKRRLALENSFEEVRSELAATNAELGSIERV
ncbi:hypothetical protein GEMRC1_006748 [Eukaryota sp. GEM-RC1]